MFWWICENGCPQGFWQEESTVSEDPCCLVQFSSLLVYIGHSSRCGSGRRVSIQRGPNICSGPIGSVVTPFAMASVNLLTHPSTESPLCCPRQWTIASFSGSQIATRRATISSLVLIFPSGLARLVPYTRHRGYVEWQRHTATSIDVDGWLFPHLSAWIKAISSAFCADTPWGRDWAQVTSMSVTSAVPAHLGPSCI